MSALTSDPCTLWTTLDDGELTVENVHETLSPIPDDLWVSAACIDRVVDDVSVQRVLIDYGIQRTEQAVERCRDAFLYPPTPPNDENAEEGDNTHVGHTKEEQKRNSLAAHFTADPADAQICRIRVALLDRLDRLNTYVDICKVSDGMEGSSSEGIDEEWEDDPWADGGNPDEDRDESSAAPQSRKSTSTDSVQELPLSLSEFLTVELTEIACLLASSEHFTGLQSLLQRHGKYLWPYRYLILDAIPEFASPEDYRDLLPAYDLSTDSEQLLDVQPWREEPDWVESLDVQVALDVSQVPPTLDLTQLTLPDGYTPHLDPLSSSALTSWYENRVDTIISSSGMVDVALALMQHGAAKGIPGLDELGEDLSLLSRLVYDAPSSDNEIPDDDWSLSRWRSMDPSAVIRSYLAHSQPATIVQDIRTLVMPYLFVLESRAERAGTPDPSLPNRLLYDYVLSSSLEIVLALIDASKPTLPAAQRLIKDDEDLARLALACLYGSDRLDAWPTMSSIFECLPAWSGSREDGDEGDAADTTIASLGAYVVPTTTRPRCTASDLFIFFKPLPASSLSHALDILDIHLESGEILARWSVPAPLRWFLQSRENVSEQRSWANRMARRAGGSDEELDTQEEWEWLLEDMAKLAGTGDGGLKGAFGLLSKEEVNRIFFSGLLSCGKFEIAQTLLHNRRSKLSLDIHGIEEICLTCSREFYDNAGSGNYKVGDMKHAYDCLGVPPQTDNIKKEKEFIEATSRLSSFNIMSRPGIPISPIEIRLTKDRLSLVSRVLSSNTDAYKHTEVILDLAYKLGFRGDPVAEVKTLAMLADTALQAEDFTRAYETSERMVDTVFKLRSSLTLGSQDARFSEAGEVCWVACYQLGRQPEFDDVEKKMHLLGRALELCPADKLHDVLNYWRRLETEDIETRKERLSSGRYGTPSYLSRNRSATRGRQPPSLSERLQNIHMPDLHISSSPLVNADAAALASRTFHRVAATFPFSVAARGRSPGSEGSGRSGSRDAVRTRFGSDEVSAQASRVFHKGIGWLIGADDDV
ncbi:hypothetical protein JAAARDRAFT_377592 [Jaapia argillacea MUCL 33604]|uniref:Sec39 domain-containing protein n=1 Tax=Jaapia argillacea MUCL 33604 TaxID=933084 RepID=A0A067QIR4_9AGAM|nr:hypothetical protein JAAARDRAFT_377592 [Jaapia argillacea MUCL 33604]